MDKHTRRGQQKLHIDCYGSGEDLEAVGPPASQYSMLSLRSGICPISPPAHTTNSKYCPAEGYGCNYSEPPLVH